MSNKVALTASMRSNLLSLKNTQKLFDNTQDHLSTGYKVNSAMDNPSSYFTAQSLNSRANDLSTLLDSIGQAISTLEVADQGITTMQDMVEQAKSVANSARDTQNVQASKASSVKFDMATLNSKLVTAQSNTAAGDKMQIRVGKANEMVGTQNVNEEDAFTGTGTLSVGGTEYTIAAGATQGVAYTYANTDIFKVVEADGTKAVIEDAAGNRFAQVAYTGSVGDFVDGITGISLNVDGTFGSVTGTAAANATATAADGVASAITVTVGTTDTLAEASEKIQSMIGNVNLSIDNGNLKITSTDTSSIEVSGNLATDYGFDQGQTITLTATDTAESLRQKIDALDGVSATFNDEGRMVIKSEQGDDLVISGGPGVASVAGGTSLAYNLGLNGTATNGNNERAAYAKQFNAILSQIDQLVQDTSYKGINLLNGDNLTVNFNESRTSSLELKGVTFDSSGLGFTQAANEWKDNGSIDKALDQITKATSMLRAQASEFGQNLSTVQIRQDFTENMINNLQSGADKLTLADMNEEGANMLALQTRQQLGLNSLSLASQAAQGVLRLF